MSADTPPQGAVEMSSRRDMAYLNDNDPFACAWLRELIVAGHLQGTVDERPIQEIKAEEVREYRQCHYFAGIGGWPYALSLAGWPADRPVWSASLPCQPFSNAGKRKGQEDERHLWPVFFRLVRECQPATIFGEQVASDDGYRWLARVRDDLEEAGYAVGCADLPACCQGAPHIRQRLFWVANSRRAGVRDSGQSMGKAPGRNQGARNKRQRVGFDFGDGGSVAPEQRRIIEECGFWPGCERTREGRHATNCPGRKWGHTHRLAVGDGQPCGQGRQERGGGDSGGAAPEGCRSGCNCSACRLAHTDGGQSGNAGVQRSGQHGQQSQDSGTAERLANPIDDSGRDVHRSRSNGKASRKVPIRREGQGTDDTSGCGTVNGMANADSLGGQNAFAPLGSGANAAESLGSTHRMGDTSLPGCEGWRLSGSGSADQLPSGQAGAETSFGAWNDYRIIACRDGRTRRIPTQPALFPLAHGLPNRVGILRGAGNAVSPQTAAHFIRAFLQTETD